MRSKLNRFILEIIHAIGINRITGLVFVIVVFQFIHNLEPLLISRLLSNTDAILSVVILCISLIAPALMKYPINTLLQNIRKDSKNVLIRQVMQKDYSFFSKHEVSEIQQLIDEISFSARGLFHDAIIPILNSFLLLVVNTVILVQQNILVGFAFAFVMVLYAIISFVVLKNNGRQITDVMKTSAQVKASLLDTYVNIDSIITHDSKDYETKLIGKDLESEKRAYYHLQDKINRVNILLQGLIVLFVVIVYLVSTYLDPGVFSPSIILILVFSLVNYSGIGSQVLTYVEYRDRLNVGIEKIGLYADQEKQSLNYISGTGLPDNVCLRLNNVTYGYDSPLKQNISFDVLKGDRILIKGGNGTGKTTLLKVIAGLMAPMSGEVSGNSSDIGYYSQSAMLFNRTILDNIVYPRPDNFDSYERVMDIIRSVGLSQLIPDTEALDTIVSGELSTRFSGGEKQKILLSRAFFEQRPIVLLDEIDASLDACTKENFLDLLGKWLPSSTIVVISHNKQDEAFFNKVIDLDRL